MAGGEQFAIEPHDLVVDPGLLALGAGAHDRFERAVGDHPESIRPHRLGEAARDDEPVEREDPALLRLDPKQVLGVAAFGHRKDADRIGPEQDVRRQLEFSRRGFHALQSWNRPRRQSSRRAGSRRRACAGPAARSACSYGPSFRHETARFGRSRNHASRRVRDWPRRPDWSAGEFPAPALNGAPLGVSQAAGAQSPCPVAPARPRHSRSTDDRVAGSSRRGRQARRRR